MPPPLPSSPQAASPGGAGGQDAPPRPRASSAPGEAVVAGLASRVHGPVWRLERGPGLSGMEE